LVLAIILNSAILEYKKGYMNLTSKQATRILGKQVTLYMREGHIKPISMKRPYKWNAKDVYALERIISKEKPRQTRKKI